MLDVTLSPTFPVKTWQALDKTANLPCKFEDFIAGRFPFVANSRRSHSRILFRGRASMRHGGSTSGVYTIDLSPNGVGLYSPVLLLPQDHIELCVNQHDIMELVVRRCRRVGEFCYVCGTNFRTGPMATIPYRDLIRQFQ